MKCALPIWLMRTNGRPPDSPIGARREYFYKAATLDRTSMAVATPGTANPGARHEKSGPEAAFFS
ncbi:MAG: hypothetical protein K0Q68_3080 [Moraxellaceae bacterium]|jgi:hypothetical protein|nr:hypothetical protein [Moraxellaceae bacterium]